MEVSLTQTSRTTPTACQLVEQAFSFKELSGESQLDLAARFIENCCKAVHKYV